jgi:hypothetical protein
MAHSWVRGHWVSSEEGKHWYYDDSGTPVDDNRPCPRCHRMPTEDGHDACIGHINDSNVVSACCGHGVWEGLIITKKGTGKDKYALADGRELRVSELFQFDPPMLRELDKLRKGQPVKYDS